MLSDLKLPKIIVSAAKAKLVESKYSSYHFGFSPECEANLSLTDSDKEALANLSPTSKLVSKNHGGIVSNNPDAHKSMSIAKGYFRHGSIEKISTLDDIFCLIYPRTGSLFNKGGNYGSNLPYLLDIISKPDYYSLLETSLVTTGEWNRYRDYENKVFLTYNDLAKELSEETYFKLSFNSVTKFKALAKEFEEKDFITKKHSVLSDEDTEKYTDNPRYNVVFSEDKVLYYITRSDKLKATALQTRITKTLREDFLRFLNWLGYYQLAADLDPVGLKPTFTPVNLVYANSASWIEHSLLTLAAKKDGLTNLATEMYRKLYLNEGSAVTCLSDSALFDFIYQAHTTGTRYNSVLEDPKYLLMFYGAPAEVLTFNKKFALDIDIIQTIRMFCRGSKKEQYINTSDVFFPHINDMSQFLTTNFIVSDSTESLFEKSLSGSRSSNGIYQISYWNLPNIDPQLLKSCVTLSSEALSIFNCVANLTTPADIISWLELSKNHFIKTLPEKLEAKYNLASASRISALLNTGIEYYLTILRAAEPFSNKLLNVDETGD